MAYNSDNIVIVGGGSSGWMVASTLIRYFPNKNITVIESPDIKTIGVGESTTAFMKNFLNSHLGIKDEEFIPETDGIFKMSVQFVDWYKKNDGGFHYPFGGAFFPDKNIFLQSWALKKYYFPDTDVRNFAESYIPAMALIDQNKMSKNEDGMFDNFNFYTDLGYHFSADKFGKFLREKYAKPRGVKHIEAKVLKVNENEYGVESLVLDNGQTVSYDLYIDCSGFRSILLGQVMKPKWISFENELFNNAAWAVPTPYKNKDVEMRAFTNSTALKNGWCWHTPVWSRVGNGYTYSNNHIDKDGALLEFKEYLMSNKVPVPFTKDEVEDLPFFHVESKAGHYDRLWVKNVVGIGLSSGFLEPLEGTGLWFVHDAALLLSRLLQREKLTNYTIDMFNLKQYADYEGWKDFIGLFYYMSIRDDSQYWRDITSVEKFDEIKHYSINSMGNYQRYMLALHSDSTSGSLKYYDGLHYMANGMRASLDLDDVIRDKVDFFDPSKRNNEYEIAKWVKELQDKYVDKWKQAAYLEPTVYQFMKDNYYAGIGD